MAEDKRLRYYNGQFLQEEDFTAEQEYHLDRQRRHNRQLHTYGIAEGLTVTAAVGATLATVSPGTALDGEGRQIVLTQSRGVPFGSFSNQWVLVVISYDQQTADPATVGDEGDTRWWERPDVEVIPEAGAPAADARIRLARLQIAANGTVSQHDTSVRTSASARLGQADVAGNLSVTGNILVTGTVDGRDVGADGASLDSHKARTDNPHNTTAAQIGALARRALVNVTFSTTDLNNATRLVSVNFPPKLASLTGFCFCDISGQRYGGAIGGVWLLNETNSPQAWSHGPYVSRLTSAPYVSFFNESSDGYIAYSRFTDQLPPLPITIALFVQVVETIANGGYPSGFTLKFVRQGSWSPNFSMGLSLVVLG